MNETAPDAAQAAAALLAAHREGAGLQALPPGQTPQDEAQAYAIQRAFMAGLGAIGGWKVGAPNPQAAPACAPMPAAWIGQAGEAPTVLSSATYRQREVESEIAFLFARDLPPRPLPYTAAELQDAIASCHPAIEVLQSRFADPGSAGALPVLADLIQHGAFVWGEAIEGWQGIDFAAMRVLQRVGGGDVTATGNPAGPMTRLLLWLADTGAAWAGGIKAGQIVTCGSWTGKTRAGAGETVVTGFEGAAPVSLRFAL